jgi:GAF domain-containing protein
VTPEGEQFAPQDLHTAQQFARLAVELHQTPSLADTVEAVAHFALQALHCRYAGIAVAVHGGHAQIGTATDPVVERLYQTQIDTGEGPMLTAMAGRVTVSVPDITAEIRWPGWRDKAAGLGVGSVLHVPMVSRHHTIGVLSLYDDKPHAFSDDDEAIAHILAQHASVAVATARLDETMAQAVDARRLVGQAIGILMERFDVDQDRAFAILRRYSQGTNTKLRDVAQHLIDTRKLPDPDR